MVLSVDIPEEEDWDRLPGVEPERGALSHLLALVRGLPYCSGAELSQQVDLIAEAVDLYDRLRSTCDEDERDALILRLAQIWEEERAQDEGSGSSGGSEG